MKILSVKFCFTLYLHLKHVFLWIFSHFILPLQHISGHCFVLSWVLPYITKIINIIKMFLCLHLPVVAFCTHGAMTLFWQCCFFLEPWLCIQDNWTLNCDLTISGQLRCVAAGTFNILFLLLGFSFSQDLIIVIQICVFFSAHAQSWVVSVDHQSLDVSILGRCCMFVLSANHYLPLVIRTGNYISSLL